MEQHSLPGWRRYGAAVLLAVLALAGTFEYFVLFQRYTFLFFIAAVVVSAWYGGLGPGLVATTLSMLGALYFVLPPLYSFELPGPDLLLALVLFLLVSVLINSIAAVQRLARQAEARQREQLRVTLASIGDAVIATDPQAQVTFMNPVAETLTGWKQIEAIGRPLETVFKIISQDTRAKVESPVLRVLREGQIVGLANHTLLLSKGGTEYCIDDSGAPIRDTRGRLTGTIMVFRDVTAQRELEDRQAVQFAVANILSNATTLEQAAPRLLEAICPAVNSPLGTLWLPNEHGTLEPLHVWEESEAVRELGNLTRARTFEPEQGLVGGVWAGGAPDWKLDIETDTDSMRSKLAAAAGLKSGIAFPLRLGDKVWGVLECYSCESTRPAAEMIALMETLGSQIGQFIERRRSEGAVRESEERYRGLVELSPDTIFLQTEGKIEFMNPAGLRLVGASNPEEVLGRPILDFVHPDDRAAVEAGMDTLLKGIPVPNAEVRWVRLDGTVIDVETAATPFRYHDRSGAQVIARDITQRKRDREALQASLAQATESRTRMEFLAEATRVLASSLDYETTLTSVAQLAVPKMADWCTVDIVNSDGTSQQLALAHVDPAKVEWAHEYRKRYPPNPNAPTGVPNVLRTGQPEYVTQVPSEQIRSTITDPEILRVWDELGLKSYMILPLRTRERTVGALSFFAAESGRQYGPEDLALAEALADRAATAIDNARLYRGAQFARRAAESSEAYTSRLQHITASLSQSMTPAAVMDVVLTEGVAALNASTGWVSLLSADQTRLEMSGEVGFEPDIIQSWRTIPMDLETPITEAVRTAEPLWISDPRELVERYPVFRSEDPSRLTAFTVVPLVFKDQALGAIAMSFREPRTFSQDDRSFTQALAQQAAQALERARLFQGEQEARAQAEAARQRVALLAEASSILATSLNYEMTLQAVVRLIVPALADYAMVYLQPNGERQLVAVAHADPEKEPLIRELDDLYHPSLTDPTSIIGSVLRSQVPALYPELPEQAVELLPNEPRVRDLYHALGARSLIVVPLVARNQPLGVLQFTRAATAAPYTTADLDLAQEIARRAAARIDNALLYRAEKQAHLAAELAVERTTSLQQITAALSESLTPQQVAETVVQRSAPSVNAAGATIFLLDPQQQAIEIFAAAGYAPEVVRNWKRVEIEMPMPASLTAQTGQSFFLESGEEVKAQFPKFAERRNSGLNALASLPLLVEGKPIGTLGLSFPGKHVFTRDEKEYLQAVARLTSQALERSRLFESAQNARDAAETARRRLGLIAQASDILASSLDYEVTLQNVADLVVPALADWVVIDLVEDDQSLRMVGVAHREAAKKDQLRELRRRFPPDPDHAIFQALVHRQSEIAMDLSEAETAARATNEAHLRLLRSVGISSHIVAPLVARGRALGAISFVLSNPQRHFEPADIALAEDLARRAAISVDNARLYREMQRLNEDLEQRVIRRTAQLSSTNQQLEREIGERKQAEMRFRNLLEAAPDSFVIVDEQGTMILINSQTEQCFGYARHELLGRPIEMLLPERFRTSHSGQRSGYSTAPIQRLMGSGADLYGLRKDGTEFPIEVTLSPLKTEEGLVVTAAIRDVTERRRAEDQVRESERQLRKSQQVGRLGSWQWDLIKNRVTWSDEMYRVYGLEKTDAPLTGESLVEHVHPEDVELVRVSLDAAVRDVKPFSFEHRIVLPNGATRTLHALGEVLAGNDGTPVRVVGTGHDITERKRAEEQLRASREQLRRLSGHLQSAREEERERIAREVHDQLGQVLSAIKIDMTLLGRKFAEGHPLTSEAVVAEVESMLKLMDETIQSVRQIIMELRPELLEDLGLLPAIEWQTQEFSNRTGIKAEMVSNVDHIDLGPERSIAVFRIVQESLTNVARHAEATKVHVTLEQEDDRLLLEVRDNGRGINESELVQTKHFGVLGMRERALLLGGEAQVTGAPGQGTTVTVTIPLDGED